MGKVNIIELLKLAPKYFITPLILASLLLFLPIKVMNRIGLDQFVLDYKQWIGLTFITSLCFIISGLLIYLIEFMMIRLKYYRLKKRLKIKLKNLSPKQLEVLKEMYRSEERSMALPFNEGYVADLENNNIIYRASNASVMFHLFSYNLDSYAVKVMDNMKEFNR